MNPLVKQLVFLGVAVVAGSVVLANLLARPSTLPPINPAAVATPPTSSTSDQAQANKIADIQQRLTANPDDTNALNDYGDYLMQSQRFPQAADVYAALVDLQPQSSLAHQKLGGALFYLGVTTLGQQELKRAIDIDPTNVEAQFNYALAMSHGPRANLEAARASWQTVVTMDPNGQLGQQAMLMLAPRPPSSPDRVHSLD